MPSAAWPGVQSKAIELTRLTWLAQPGECPKRFMALGAIELTRLT